MKRVLVVTAAVAVTVAIAGVAGYVTARIGDWFYHVNVLSVLGCQDGLLRVQIIGKYQKHPIDVIAPNESFVALFLVASKLFAVSLSVLGNYVEAGGQFGVFAFLYCIGDDKGKAS